MKRLGIMLFFGCAVATAGTGTRAQDAVDPPTPETIAAKIDALIQKAWREADVVPSPPADEATLLRRPYLDLTGRIPTADEARAYFEDDRPGKYQRLIEQLLQKPSHATHLANVWRDVMLPDDAGPSDTFTAWLRSQLAEDKPYDRIVRQLLTATGANGAGPLAYYAAVDLKPEELAAGTSRIFLGVQIGCAQCHGHPFAAWKQSDFWSFAAFFGRIGSSGGGLVDLNQGDLVMPGTQRVMAPRFLTGEMSPDEQGTSRRRRLADWITSPENPYFARATVNRVWSLLLGRGLIEPVDDLDEHNPGRHPQIVQVLANDLVASGFDLKRLFRVITACRVYQLSSDGGGQDSDPALFATMAIKSLSAEQLYDCLMTATSRREPLAGDRGEAARRQAFLEHFRAPTRQSTEFQGGIPQALSMLNGSLVADATDLQKSDLLAALVDAPFLSDKDRIETLYLATLSRLPRPEERLRLEKYIAASKTANERQQALADVLWALLNSSEFLLNH